MRLAVSNIAWDVTEDQKVADLLSDSHIDAIDIAPGKYFPEPGEATSTAINAVRKWWSARGIEVTGMQALLFGTEGLNVFGDAQSQSRLLQHLQTICQIAEQLRAPLLVFGSPRNRDKGNLNDEQALDIATTFFCELGNIAQRHGVTFCLEPNPVQYGANFMTTSSETAKVVRALNHSAIRMQFDSGAITINKESPSQVLTDYKNLIGHCHLSEPDLLPLGDACSDHSEISLALATHLPKQLLSIEMLSTTRESPIASLQRAIQFCDKHYRDNSGKKKQ